MKRMMIQVDEVLLEGARRRAAARGISVAQLVREALERELGSTELQPEIRSAGAFDTGRGGVARRDGHGEYEPPPFRS